MPWEVVERKIGRAGGLSPLHIHVVGDAKTTLEQFWQEKKCPAVWQDESLTTQR